MPNRRTGTIDSSVGEHRAWLRRFSSELIDALKASTLANGSVRFSSRSQVFPKATDTDGLFATLGTLRGGRGVLQVWFDDWTRSHGRRVSFCIEASRERIEGA